MLTEYFYVLRRQELIVFLTSQRTTVSVAKKVLLDITQFFAGHCPMSGANIQPF